jgi:hypothetical protein
VRFPSAPRLVCFKSDIPSYQRLGLFDVFVSEQKLPVEVAEVNGIEVDNVDFAEASEDKVLEKFAAYSAGADHEDARLFHKG